MDRVVSVGCKSWLFWFAETAKEIWAGILHWQAACGAPLERKS